MDACPKLTIHPNKIQLTQELKPPDISIARTFADWMHEQTQLDDDFALSIR